MAGHVTSCVLTRLHDVTTQKTFDVVYSTTRLYDVISRTVTSRVLHHDHMSPITEDMLSILPGMMSHHRNVTSCVLTRLHDVTTQKTCDVCTLPDMTLHHGTCVLIRLHDVTLLWTCDAVYSTTHDVTVKT